MAASGELNLPNADKVFDLPVQRTPYRLKNLTAFKQLKSIMDVNKYEIVHCHTPMGGMLARLAARQTRKQGTKVIYTAHGFHFCKGAPLLNWLVYYPIEKMMASLTDCLITINEEDYALAVKRRFSASRIELVHGVGVNTEVFKPLDAASKCGLRLAAGYGPDDFLMFNAAEFNKNKNQQLLIQAVALMKDEMPNAKLLLAGNGPLFQKCRELAARLGVADKVRFHGYRKDISSLLPMCDVAVASSLREGLPVNIMEAMASGLPIVATSNRGHSELIEDNKNGYLINGSDSRSFADRLLELGRSKYLCKKMGIESVNRVGKYSLSQVGAELGHIYSQLISEDWDETESKHSSAYL